MKNDVGTIRTGRATPALVENIVISAYGGTAKLKLMELATVGIQDAQTIVITPFDQSIIEEIRKGITDANVGMNPMVDGHILRISIPPLSKERREELIKLMKHKLENGRIMIRQVRHQAMEDIKKMDLPEDDTDRAEKEIQKQIDDAMQAIDYMGTQKEEELLQI
jgi:ribosome recycling factor